MKLDRYYLRNFRRLEDVEVKLEDQDTIFVGPNNSGKTSSTAAFKMLVALKENLTIYDFPALLLKQMDDYGFAEDDVEFSMPEISLDLWFAINPETEYGRIATFLPSLSLEHSEIGVRVVFSVEDDESVAELKKQYLATYPKTGDKQPKSLSHFLSQDGQLRKYFKIHYFALECTCVPFDAGKVVSHPLPPDEGKNTLNSLLRVDFVEAQRKVDDLETARSNRLSSVFADYYKFNLEKPENDVEAVTVIDESNDRLTKHYEDQFKPLIDAIRDLGVPAANDRDLKIFSTLNPETILKGNTTLQYIDSHSDHLLPEAYNGLGFKNLIFMTIQISHFQQRWLATEVNRPLCQVIFIEEPEVHLHAQVQQVFIRQMAKISKKVAKDFGETFMVPQLLLTTHSSHILDEAEFTKIRYFRRVPSKYQDEKVKIKNASKVVNLSTFNETLEEPENINFLKRYLKLTHCDLFFADACVLIEGTVERLLFPSFIDASSPELNRSYLSVLEVSGAYAHRFLPLTKFIGIPTLVVTDLDSVEEKKGEKTTSYPACRADTPNALTSNGAIKWMLADEDKDTKLTVEELISKSREQRTTEDTFVAYQGPVSVPDYGADKVMIPRTFEEAFTYENISAVREGKLNVLIELPDDKDFESDYKNVYETVKSKNYKKVDFAMNQIDTDFEWKTPSYIADGLKWLQETLITEAQPNPVKEVEATDD